jgi:hypothetical protein
VACELIDASGVRHAFIDKVWIFLDETLDADSEYPRAAELGCNVLSEWHDADGRHLVRVDTSHPDSLESVEGLNGVYRAQDAGLAASP